jgi:hydrogenase maturation factor
MVFNCIFNKIGFLMDSIKGEEAKESSKHHGQMSNQTGSNPIILEIRKECVQYDMA